MKSLVVCTIMLNDLESCDIESPSFYSPDRQVKYRNHSCSEDPTLRHKITIFILNSIGAYNYYYYYYYYLIIASAEILSISLLSFKSINN